MILPVGPSLGTRLHAASSRQDQAANKRLATHARQAPEEAPALGPG